MVQCGRCRKMLPVAEADLAADGYRCLSCSMDEAQEVRIAGDYADIERMNALKMLRVSLFGGLLLPVFIVYCEGAVRWGAVIAAVGLASWTVQNVRVLLR
jgi:hypothetical protein